MHHSEVSLYYKCHYQSVTEDVPVVQLLLADGTLQLDFQQHCEEAVSEDCQLCIKGLMHPDPRERLTVAKALEYDWLKHPSGDIIIPQLPNRFQASLTGRSICTLAQHLLPTIGTCDVCQYIL